MLARGHEGRMYVSTDSPATPLHSRNVRVVAEEACLALLAAESVSVQGVLV